MPRSYDEIMKHAEALSQHAEDDFQPSESPVVAAIKAAAFKRARAEAETAEAVVSAALAGTPWRVIGDALGTSGEAARQRYSKLCDRPGLKGRSLTRPLSSMP